MSPSGLPPLQVMRAAGIVRLIVLPVLPLKTPSSPVVGPRAVQAGKVMLARAEQLAKQYSPMVVALGRLMVTREVQY